MKWTEISIHTTQEAIEPVANILHEAGASGVVIEDPELLQREWEDKFGEIYQLSPEDFPEEGVIVKGYLPVTSFLAETIEEIKDRLNQLLLYDIDLGLGTVTLSEVHEHEWATAWKKYYKPVQVSNKITITPTWEEYQPLSSDEIVIELDPGMAFGTGTHPTTVLCIRGMEKVIRGNESMIDVGCGTGVLSIAAAKLGVSSVLALDLDEVAVESAKINVKLNQVQHIVKVKQNNLLDYISEKADIIVANILAEVILRLVDQVSYTLNDEGIFIASGIISNRAQEVISSLEKVGLEVIETLKDEDWVAIIAKKVSK
ncbi:50S ribosomal protein L11 methyltransferase [Microaerobacter geothermalis]|uniref:50S ribosomal protein L11 methyltransferase n=1 Tax=Microaerobacter geothermalis TaxID=674972 RepID=UPI001F27C076|nr:50S ribosomal protein L11 methyltransferase [Microaerobacter geothermalis]MCF6092862.1 50S ribosomal protein L11 methyltransferase [Microaerobacter geothermalis]